MRATESLHDALRDVAGFQPRRVWVHASAENLGDEVSAQFGVPPTTLGWYVESLNCDAGGRAALSLTQRWIRADIVRVVLDSSLGRAGPR
jgi:DNA-binding GntR family transcriptional regulator